MGWQKFRQWVGLYPWSLLLIPLLYFVVLFAGGWVQCGDEGCDVHAVWLLEAGACQFFLVWMLATFVRKKKISPYGYVLMQETLSGFQVHFTPQANRMLHRGELRIREVYKDFVNALDYFIRSAGYSRGQAPFELEIVSPLFVAKRGGKVKTRLVRYVQREVKRHSNRVVHVEPVFRKMPRWEWFLYTVVWRYNTNPNNQGHEAGVRVSFAACAATQDVAKTGLFSRDL